MTWRVQSRQCASAGGRAGSPVSVALCSCRPLEVRPPFVVSIRPMSTPQDSPNRKKQKFRAARKLAEWRKKQEALKAAEPAATPKK
jgi:hypothetical protein